MTSLAGHRHPRQPAGRRQLHLQPCKTRQGLQVCCPEEIAFAQKWIDAAQIQKLAAPLAKNGYGQEKRKKEKGKRGQVLQSSIHERKNKSLTTVWRREYKGHPCLLIP